MMIEKRDKFRQWFQDIQERIVEADREQFSYLGWTISARELLRAVYGEHSLYYREFCDWEGEQGALVSIFQAAKRDYDGGFSIGDIRLRISGDVLGNFVALARTLLDDGHKDVAGVLAAAALEDVLKRYATANDIDTEDRNMPEVINALKSKGLIKGGQNRLLQALPKIRNLALHAQWDKFSELEVGSVLGYVEQFLLKHFSYSKLLGGDVVPQEDV